MTKPLNRLVVPLAALSAATVIVVSFPFSTLLGQSAQLDATAHQIAVLQSERQSLLTQQKALSTTQAATLLARQEYQLVEPGQRLIQILSNGPSNGAISTGDPGDAPLVNPSNGTGLLPLNPAATSPSGTPPPGLWSRVLRTFEFWR